MYNDRKWGLKKQQILAGGQNFVSKPTRNTTVLALQGLILEISAVHFLENFVAYCSQIWPTTRDSASQNWGCSSSKHLQMLCFSSTFPIKFRNIFHMFSFNTDFSTPWTYFKPFHSYPSCLFNTSSASVPAGVKKKKKKSKNKKQTAGCLLSLLAPTAWRQIKALLVALSAFLRQQNFIVGEAINNTTLQQETFTELLSSVLR